MKLTEFKKLIREEVRKQFNEAAGQTRDNVDNVNALVSLLRKPGMAKEVKEELTDILSWPENKKFAQTFDNMISNYLDEPIRDIGGIR